MAGALEERRHWLTQAAEQAEKDRAHAESEVQAAKKSLASENDIRVGSREVRCSLQSSAGHRRAGSRTWALPLMCERRTLLLQAQLQTLRN